MSLKNEVESMINRSVAKCLYGTGDIKSCHDSNMEIYYYYRNMVELMLLNRNLDNDSLVLDVSKLNIYEFNIAMKNLIKYTLRTVEKSARFSHFTLDLRGNEPNLGYSYNSVSNAESFLMYKDDSGQTHYELQKVNEPVYFKMLSGSDSEVFSVVSEVSNIDGVYTDFIVVKGNTDKILSCLANPTDVVITEDNVCITREVTGSSSFESMNKLFKPNTVVRCYRMPDFYGAHYEPYSAEAELKASSFDITYDSLMNTSRYADVIKMYGVILNTCNDILQVDKNNFKGLGK